MADQPANDPMPLQGEGAYDAARRYREGQEAFAKSGKVEQKAREAEEALEGPEAADLEAARQEAARGEPLEDKG